MRHFTASAFWFAVTCFERFLRVFGLDVFIEPDSDPDGFLRQPRGAVEHFRLRVGTRDDELDEILQLGPVDDPASLDLVGVLVGSEGWEPSNLANAQAWEAMGEAGKKGPLDEKTARLIKLAVAIGALREGAVHANVRKARSRGISPEEIDEVIFGNVAQPAHAAMVADAGLTPALMWQVVHVALSVCVTAWTTLFVRCEDVTEA